jgi:hypothetical protein
LNKTTTDLFQSIDQLATPNTTRQTTCQQEHHNRAARLLIGRFQFCRSIHYVVCKFA